MKTWSCLFGLVVAVGLMALAPAEAKDFPLGSPPIAVISVPDSWKPTASDEGVEATSPAGFYFAAEAVQISDVETATKEGIEYFQGQGITLDPSTMKKTESKVGDFPAVDVSWRAKDEDGPTNVGLTFVIISGSQSVLFYLWGDDETTMKSVEGLEEIAKSLKAVAR